MSEIQPPIQEDAGRSARMAARIEAAKQKAKDTAVSAEAAWTAGTPPAHDPRWALWDAVAGLETDFCTGEGEFKNARNATACFDYLAKAFVTTRDIRPDLTPEQLTAAVERWEAHGATGREPVAARKDGPFISGAVLKDDSDAPNPCTDPDAKKNLVNSNIKFVGRVHAFDIDDTDGTRLEKFRQRLRERQIAYNIYSTHSHRANNVKVRIVVYADQDLPAGIDDERALVAKVRKAIGLDLFDAEEDHSRHNAAGLIFLPSHNGSKEATDSAFSFFEPGKSLDLQPYIEQAKLAMAQERAGMRTPGSGSGAAPADDSDKARKRHDLRQNIRQGSDIHKSCVALASMLWFAGWSDDEIVADLETALYDCEGSIEPSRWRERFNNIRKVVKDQEKFAHKSEFFGAKQERRERDAETRAAEAEAAAAREQKEQENRAQHEATRAELEAKIAALQRSDMQAAGELLKMLAWLLLDAVTTELLLTSIVDAVKPEGATSARATDKVRKPLAALLKEETRQAKEAREREQRQRKEDDKAAAAEARARAREQEPADDDPRPWLDVVMTDADIVIGKAWDAVKTYNTPAPKIFRGPAGLARVIRDKDDRPKIGTFETGPQLTNEMKHVVRWVALRGKDEDDEPIVVNDFANGRVIDDMLAEPSPPVPVLNGIMVVPRIARNGSIVTTPGYNADLSMIYAPDAGFMVPDVPEVPSANDVARAKELIFDNLLEGFCFRDAGDPVRHEADRDDMAPWDRRKLYGQASRANAAAALLTQFIRPLLGATDCTPLFLFDKNNQRVGATKLANAIGLVALGRPAPISTAPATEEEWRKTILTFVAEGVQQVVLDNVQNLLASASLAAALTTRRQAGRGLGANKQIDGDVNWLWMATGNNITVDTDIAKRSVMIRQVVKHTADPELRDDFKHAQLEAWIAEHRCELVWACLVLVRNWLAQGATKDERLKFGGAFDTWARIMDGVLGCAGVEGFLANRKQMTLGRINNEKTQLVAFVTAWLDRFGERVVRVGDHSEPILSDAGSLGGERKCGGLLRMMRDEELTLGDVDVGEKASVQAARTKLGIALGRYTDNVLAVEQREKVGVDAAAGGVGTVDRWRVRTVLASIVAIADKHAKSPGWRLEIAPQEEWRAE